MTFSEQLNIYIKNSGLTSKELASLTGISQSTVSRYRNQKKNIRISDAQLRTVSRVLAEHSDEDAQTIFSSLKSLSKKDEYDVEQTVSKLNYLIDEFNINVSVLAKWLNFDSSYLSRIRSGQRKPSDFDGFVAGISSFFTRRLSESELDSLSKIINSDGVNLKADLIKWFGTYENIRENRIQNFLTSVDSFDLDEYVKAADYDRLKIPTLPFTLPTNRFYYGIADMRKAELDFFKLAATSKSDKDIFLHNEMPITDMASDEGFFKNIMLATAVILKKGLRINVIHNLDRPWNEMMLGLEGWVPLYMTGRISPYYLKQPSQSPYKNSLHTSGTAVLSGKCVKGFPKDGRYCLTTNKNEVAFYNKIAEQAISTALPLMKVFNKTDSDGYSKELININKADGERTIVNSSLPIYTISEKLFKRICRENSVSESKTEELWRKIELQRGEIEETLLRCNINEYIPAFEKMDFVADNYYLALSDFFPEKPVLYSRKTFEEHLKECRRFEESHEGYAVKINSHPDFKNIRIAVISDRCAVISKILSPTIHFVIHHPRLVKAIKKFCPASE